MSSSRSTLSCTGCGSRGTCGARTRDTISAEARNVAVSIQSARFSWLRPRLCNGVKCVPRKLATPTSAVKTRAPSGNTPYVVKSAREFVATSNRFGTRFGTSASFAGNHTSVAISRKKVTAYKVGMLATKGTVAISAARARSDTTMALRRSMRSRSTPASGPMMNAGSTRKIIRPATARVLPGDSLFVIESSAKRPTQSPRLETDMPIHSRRKLRSLRIVA
jgi:hypothetical protein